MGIAEALRILSSVQYVSARAAAVAEMPPMDTGVSGDCANAAAETVAVTARKTSTAAHKDRSRLRTRRNGVRGPGSSG